MSIIIIPTSIIQSNYTQNTALDGRDYELTFEWSQREDRWYLTIASDGVILASMIKIVANWPLLRLHTSELLPPGQLLAIDTTGQGQDPGLRTLGSNILLMYFEESEFA